MTVISINPAPAPMTADGQLLAADGRPLCPTCLDEMCGAACARHRPAEAGAALAAHLRLRLPAIRFRRARRGRH